MSQRAEAEKEKELEVKIDQLKELMGTDEFNAFMEFKTNRDLKNKKAQAKAMAESMLTEEGGKYYEEYTELDTKMTTMYNKALAEAQAEVGIVDAKK